MLKHIRKTVDTLKDAGATDIQITNGKHFQFTFILNGKPEVMTVSCSPRKAEAIPIYVTSAIRKLNKQ